MLLLDVKDNKYHWKHEVSPGVWEFISDEKNDEYWAKEKELFERIAADVYNRAFNESSSN